MWRNPWDGSNVEIPKNGYDYIIYGEDTDGDGVVDIIYAKNGKTGKVKLKDSDWGKVINSMVPTNGNVSILTKNVGASYKFTTPINVEADNVSLLSDGAVVEWGVKDTSTIPIEVKGNNIEIAGFDFREMYWTAIWANHNGSNVYDGITIRDNKFTGWGGASDNFSYGAYVTVMGYNNVDISKNYFDINDDAIQVVPLVGNDNNNIRICSNYVNGSNIEIGGLGTLTTENLHNVILCHNTLVVSTTTGKGYILLSGSTDGAVIHSNYFNSGYGVYVYASLGNPSVKNVLITENEFINSGVTIYPSNSSTVIDGLSITNNKAYIEGNSNGAVAFVSLHGSYTIGTVNISGNDVLFNGDYDQRFINVDNGVTVQTMVVSNNFAKGVSVGYQFTVLGTINKYVQKGNYLIRTDGYPLYDENNGVATIPSGQTSVTVNHYSNTGSNCYYTSPRTFIAIAEDGTPISVTINSSVSATLSVSNAPSSDLKVYWIMRV